LQLTSEYVAAIAVAVVEAQKRINIDAPTAITFFSVNDEWVFTAEFDNVVCDDCLEYENQTLTGAMLRSLFPLLEVVDLETILPHVHPNCRCRLERTVYYGDIGMEIEP
jgi:hypothetical protein